MRVKRLDHLVLTVTDLPATLNFYTGVCGMSHVVFGEGRHALTFGDQKINLHIWGSEFEPRAALATPGSADLCFLVDSTPAQVLAQLADLQVAVERGPVERTGATGPITSVYVRDPDGNLVELATPAVTEPVTEAVGGVRMVERVAVENGAVTANQAGH